MLQKSTGSGSFVPSHTVSKHVLDFFFQIDLNYFAECVHVSSHLTHYYNPSGACVPSWCGTVYSVHVCYAQRPFLVR